LVAGRGLLTLSAPTPAGSTLTVDLALNLGSSGTDQSCQASHPASTGAAQPWLRSQNGGCAASADRDPAGRASFGVYSPESRRSVHIRDVF
jgi:MSHA biogenesis protein MshQ